MPFYGLLSICNQECSKTVTTRITLDHLITQHAVRAEFVATANEAELQRSFDDSKTAQSHAEYSFWGTCGKTQL